MVLTEFCIFKMAVIKWQLNFVSCNFGLKSYLGFQIQLALRSCPILKSRVWFQTKLHSTQFNLPLLILSPEISHLLSTVIINGYNILKVLTFVKSSCFEYWLLRTWAFAFQMEPALWGIYQRLYSTSLHQHLLRRANKQCYVSWEWSCN